MSQLLDTLGPSLLTVVAAPAGASADVLDVEIHDPVEQRGAAAGELVLGVGLHDRADVLPLLAQLGRVGAAGLVVKSPGLAADDELLAAVRGCGVPLLELTRGASWAQVGALIRSLLVPAGGLGEGRDGMVGQRPDNLFGLADAVSALLDAPVTIEDTLSRVLAFSAQQDEADAGRRETILGRRVPDRYARVLEERGVFRRLLQSSSPVYVEGITAEALPRLAVSVRAGDEVLGSMWAAVTGRLSADKEQGFADAAKVVALHMLRLRAGADVGRRLRADLLATLLEGAVGAGEAASRLGMAGSERLCVLAAARSTGAERSDDGAPQRLADALGVYLAALRPRSAVALLGEVVYAVVTPGAGAELDAVVGLLDDFLQRAQDGESVRVGIGRATGAIAGLPRSRLEADRALRVLCQTSPGQPHVARFADVQLDSLLLRLADLVAEDGDVPVGAVTLLAAHDAEHGSELLASLEAYLTEFGDVRRAAAAVHVHPNTFRYRLRRIAELSGLDLADADQRFEAALQLRLGRLLSSQDVGGGIWSPGSGAGRASVGSGAVRSADGRRV